MARVLLDNCVHSGFAKFVPGHAVTHVVDIGWDQFDDGKLLDSAAGKYDVVVTLDRSLRYQQPKRISHFVLIVLRPRNSRLRDLQPPARRVISALKAAMIGDVVEITSP